MIPEGQPKHNDLTDIVIASSQRSIDVEQKDGSITKEQIIDEEILWCKTQSIASCTFGRYMFELKEWDRCGKPILENKICCKNCEELQI